jgi:hypothetical protein
MQATKVFHEIARGQAQISVKTDGSSSSPMSRTIVIEK